MESLQVRTGEIHLQILDDLGNERGIFTFNPQDVHSAKIILSLQDEFKEAEANFEEREKNCKTIQDKINLLDEVVDYFEGLIDNCFGQGSSELIFGKSKSLSMFEDFFNGIIPYYQKASEERIAKYGRGGGK